MVDPNKRKKIILELYEERDWQRKELTRIEELISLIQDSCEHPVAFMVTEDDGTVICRSCAKPIGKDIGSDIVPL